MINEGQHHIPSLTINALSLLLVTVHIDSRIPAEWSDHHKIHPRLYHGTHKTPIESTHDKVNMTERGILALNNVLGCRYYCTLCTH